jgi:hypothetical protein
LRLELLNIEVNPLPSNVGKYTLHCHSGISGPLSPYCAITLGDDRQHANIPAEAEYFAFAYPVSNSSAPEPESPEVTSQHANDLDNFRKLGGFVYFDSDMHVCRISSLTLGPGLHFKREMLTDHPACVALREALHASERLQPVTLDSLVLCGVRSFCWVGPNEKISGIDTELLGERWPHGAFVYCYTDEQRHLDCVFRVLGGRERPDADAALSEVNKLRDQQRRLTRMGTKGHMLPLGERIKQIESTNSWQALPPDPTRLIWTPIY